MKKFLLIILALVLLISCGGEKFKVYEKNGVTVYENNVTSGKDNLKYDLVKLATINNSQTDTTYVIDTGFGISPDIYARADKDGNVYVVGTRKSTIYKFDSEGNYIKSIGSPGQGPGEFPRFPISVSIEDNILYVGDMSGRLSKFDTDGNFISLQTVPDRQIRRFSGVIKSENGYIVSSFVRKGNWREGNMQGGFGLFLTSDSLVVKSKLIESVEPFDRENMNPDPETSIEVTTSSDGKIYVAPVKKDSYKIFIYNKKGKKTGEIIKRHMPLERTPEQLQIRKEYYDERASNSRRNVTFKPVSSKRYALSKIFTDNNDNLWVSVKESMFSSKEPQVFDVFSKEGKLIATVKVPELAGKSVVSSNGYLVATTASMSDEEEFEPQIDIYELEVSEN